MLVHGIQMLLQQVLNGVALQIVEADVHSLQNRKYRCAIGRLAAGSQVSSWPSACTL